MAMVCEVDLARMVEHLTGQLGENERSELEAHIATGCDQCSERISALGGVVSKTEPDESTRQMLAQPLLDTQIAQPAGVRGGAVLSRRRVYEAENKICIDIEQYETQPGLSTIDGQILVRGRDLDEATGATVSLSVSGNKIAESRVDEIGDFSIADVPSGIYDVIVVMGSMEAVIKGIEV
ncbi:MAG: hypothetical protein IIC24_04215 [Chloroflexi bacterium]|nr:hypothetical protein [Chloroflexota bacterium]